MKIVLTTQEVKNELTRINFSRVNVRKNYDSGMFSSFVRAISFFCIQKNQNSELNFFSSLGFRTSEAASAKR